MNRNIDEIMADGAVSTHAWSSFFSRDEARELMRAAVVSLGIEGYVILKRDETARMISDRIVAEVRAKRATQTPSEKDG